MTVSYVAIAFPYAPKGETLSHSQAIPIKLFALHKDQNHGENQRGAFNANSGQKIQNCTNAVVTDPAGPADTNIFASGYISDRINCNYLGNANNNGRFYAGLKSNGDTKTEFDDKIKFFFEDSGSIWVPGSSVLDDNGTPADATDDFAISQTLNNNLGDIDIGTSNPQEKLHVDGDVKAFDIRAEGYCDDLSTTADCMPASVLAGNQASMRCPAGTVIKKIEKNSVICEDPFIGLNFSCGTATNGAQLYLKEIFSDGKKTCCDLSAPLNPPVCTTF